ncbi:hypothetical protein OROHE_013843 [Orobanche hederae]
MTDRVSPSPKPNGTTTHPTPAAAALPIPNPPATKAHLYNPKRHPYRPTPTSRHRHKHDRRFSCRRCLCITCFWSVLILISILLLAAIASAAFYALYQPRRPTFSVISLKISAFNLTTTADDSSSAHLTTRINITLATRNTNKKITYYYDPISTSVVLRRKKSFVLAIGSFANFTTSPNNISVIHTALARNILVLEPDVVNSLKSDLKRKRGLPMEIVMDTRVGVKMEKLNMKKIGIRIKCGVIHGLVPKGKKVTPANTANAKCKVVPTIKIWKWTFLL